MDIAIGVPENNVKLDAQEQHVLLPEDQVEGPGVCWMLLIALTMFSKNDTIYLIKDHLKVINDM